MLMDEHQKRNFCLFVLETAAGDYPPPMEIETHLVSAEQQWSRKERSQSSCPRWTHLYHPNAAAPPERNNSYKQWAWMLIRENQKMQESFLCGVPHCGWTIWLYPQLSKWCSLFPFFNVHVKNMTKVNWPKLLCLWSQVNISMWRRQTWYLLLNCSSNGLYYDLQK